MSQADQPPRAEGDAIRTEGLTRSFGRTRALAGVDLTVPWGCTLALFGPNGAGKSTLLRVLATLTMPDAGSVRVGGFERHRDAGRIRAMVGYVGHQTLLYDDLTAEENLRFYARLYGVGDAASRVEELLTDVGLIDRAGQRVGTFSNGMQKRLAIARALVHRPSVLLLDEPEAGLDEAGLGLLERVVRGVTAAGAAGAMSTHDVDRGLALADRVAVLTTGRVALDCAAHETDAVAIRGYLNPAVATAP